MRNRLFAMTMIFAMFFSTAFLLADEQNKAAKKAYTEGKKKSMDRKWDEAIEKFETVIRDYPGTRYQDDARFWIGYCQEKIPGRQLDAFNTYAGLITEYPTSSWVDDAIVHQISIAEQFVREGQPQYRAFLTGKLDHSAKGIRQQAALALGRLGDPIALPALKEMVDDEYLGEQAENLIESINESTHREQLAESPDLDEEGSFKWWAADQNKTSDSRKDDDDSGMLSDDFMFFSTKRYEHYRNMLKKEDLWTEQELMEFGLWHVLETNQFDEYQQLSNSYDRTEWLRKFWKDADPTPTTPRNEAQEEFERRVLYAKAHFYQYWNYSNIRYLRDQHIRLGWEHAPWDARGETYIKYGEPGFRTFIDNKTENWIYYEFQLDLVISRFMTNIYGNAIFGTTIHGKLHNNDPIEQAKAEAEYVYNSQFIYFHDYQAKELKGFKVHELANAEGLLKISYEFPKKELRQSRRNSDSEMNYQLTYVVYDEDRREIFRDEEMKDYSTITFKDGNAFEILELHFPRGNYLFAMRIEVPNVKTNKKSKLGIYKSEVSVSNTVYQTVHK